jgi:hypothetical protein
MAPRSDTMNYGAIVSVSSSESETPPFSADKSGGSNNSSNHGMSNNNRLKIPLLLAGALVIAFVYVFTNNKTILRSTNGSTLMEDDGGNFHTRPLSLLSPEDDLGLFGVERESDALPSSIWKYKQLNGEPLPTNSWYQNLVSHQGGGSTQCRTHQGLHGTLYH